MSERIERLPARAENAHKGDAGDLLVIAGSRRLAGAAQLCALGAARSGAGFVRLAVPAGIADRCAQGRPSLIVLPQRQSRAGEFAFSARADLEALGGAADAVVLGPGLGRGEDLSALVATLVAAIDRPLVLDADGLFALGADGLETLQGRKNVVITPHPGEAARLLGTTTGAIEADRVAAVRALAERSGTTAVLKGAGSLVRCGRREYRNDTGNPAMATAGMGDVLAGMIGALLAAGLDGFGAASIAVRAHGRAGDLALAGLGGGPGCDRGLVAEDLGASIPRALAEPDR